VRRSVFYSPLRGNEDIYCVPTVLSDSRKCHLFPSMRVSAVQRFLLNDMGVKDRQLARCGGRLDVRGLVCLLPDNTGCHIKMLTRSDMALLECHSQPFNKSSPPPLLPQLVSSSVIFLYLSLYALVFLTQPLPSKSHFMSQISWNSVRMIDRQFYSAVMVYTEIIWRLLVSDRVREYSG